MNKTMKKYITIALLSIIALITVGCSMFSTKLNGENINDYLKIKVSTSAKPDSKHVYFSEKVNGDNEYFYTYLTLKGSVKGASDNFNYNNVKVKMKVTMECQGFDYPSREPSTRTFEEELEFNCDIAGNADTFTKTYEFDDFGANSKFVNVHVEITDIEGNVTKAK